MEVLYRAQATASGGGREDGRSTTDDGKIDVRLSTPREMGGKGGDGTNPEQLFATGYAACYLAPCVWSAARPARPSAPTPRSRPASASARTPGAKASTWTST